MSQQLATTLVAPDGAKFDPTAELTDMWPVARLLASAPDLLIACKAARLAMVHLGNRLNWPPVIPMSYAVAIKLLAEAIEMAEVAPAPITIEEELARR